MNNFKGSAAWGYMSCSQPYSMYENLSITNSDLYIYDTTTNQVMEYKAASKSWNVISGADVLSTIGAGRLSFNKKTGKLYYCTGNEILHIASV